MTAQPTADLPPEAQRVYAAIAQAAKFGKPAPSTEKLNDINRRDARGTMKKLVLAGLIQIDRQSNKKLCRRRFRDLRTGRWTAWLTIRDDRQKLVDGHTPLPPRAVATLAMLRDLAKAGATLPHAREIETALGHPPGSLSTDIKSMTRRDLVGVEFVKQEMRRRIWVRDIELWTGWSEPPPPPPPPPRKAEPEPVAAVIPPAPPTTGKPKVVGDYGDERYRDMPGFERFGREVWITRRLPGGVLSCSSLVAAMEAA